MVLLSNCLKKYNLNITSSESNSTESTARHNNYVISITTRIAPDTVISSRKTPQILCVGSHLTTHHHPVRLGLFRSLIAQRPRDRGVWGFAQSLFTRAKLNFLPSRESKLDIFRADTGHGTNMGEDVGFRSGTSLESLASAVVCGKIQLLISGYAQWELFWGSLTPNLSPNTSHFWI